MRRYFIVLMLLLSQLRSVGQDSTWFNLGEHFYLKSQFSDAVYDFSKSIESGYQVALSYAYKGAAEVLNGNVEEARKSVNTALALDSTDCYVLFFKGRVAFFGDEVDSSIFWYRKAIGLNNSRAEFYDALAIAYNSIGKYDSALEYENRALAINDINTPAIMGTYRTNLGFIKQSMGKYEEALNEYEAALKLSYDAIVLTDIAFCKYKLKEYEDALSICNKALNIVPIYGAAYEVRGKIYYDMGEKDKACEDFKSFSLTKGVEQRSKDDLKQYGCQ